MPQINLTPSPEENMRAMGYQPGSGSLQNTLPGETPSSTGATLPTSGMDQLTLLKIGLRDAAQLAAKGGMRSGLDATFSGLKQSAGFDPSKVSGGTVGNIIDFVEKQVTNPIQTNLETIGGIVDSIAKKKKEVELQTNQLRDDARSQITQAINGGFWNTLQPEQKKELWKSAGYSGEPTSAKDNNIEFKQIEDSTGAKWNVGLDKTTGKVVSRNLIAGGKKGESDDDKDTKAFFSEAAALIQKLDAPDPTNKIDWRTAWDTLHLKYPKASTELIDQTLGIQRRNN